MSALPDQDGLLADLKATFPGIFARPLGDFGAQGWGHGVWTGADGTTMPDGLPIFSNLMEGEETHDGGVHTAFLAWLEARGWYVETWDGETHLIVPIALAEALT